MNPRRRSTRARPSPSRRRQARPAAWLQALRRIAPGRFLEGLRAHSGGRRDRAAAARARQKLRGSVDRWAERSSARAAARHGKSLIGLDVARVPARLRGTSWLPVVAAAVVGALFLAGLRMDVIRMRLARAASFEEELRLEQEGRELTVEMRRLRDPAELSRQAEALGFHRAERLIDLDPAAPHPQPAPAAPTELAATRPVDLASARRESRR
jgi:hypothetical protein